MKRLYPSVRQVYQRGSDESTLGLPNRCRLTDATLIAPVMRVGDQARTFWHVNGESESERRATSDFAFDGDLTAERFSQAFADRKPKTGTAPVVGAQPAELLEYHASLVCRYAETGVDHVEVHPTAGTSDRLRGILSNPQHD